MNNEISQKAFSKAPTRDAIARIRDHDAHIATKGVFKLDNCRSATTHFHTFLETLSHCSAIGLRIIYTFMIYPKELNGTEGN